MALSPRLPVDHQIYDLATQDVHQKRELNKLSKLLAESGDKTGNDIIGDNVERTANLGTLRKPRACNHVVIYQVKPPRLEAHTLDAEVKGAF
eukprot:6208610-Pleurochrysis_carterae.AAC.1